MGRKPSVFVEGGVYHVYCRTAHGERAFEDPDEAAAFVEVLRETKERDGSLRAGLEELFTVQRPGRHGLVVEDPQIHQHPRKR